MLKVGIVGVGPKGLYAFARLVEKLSELSVENVTIYLFEKSGKFGTGPIYNTNQPDYLLMNYENAHIDHSDLYFKKEAPSFSEFIQQESGFSPRAKVGSYLKDLFDKTLEKAKDIANVILCETELIDLIREGDHFLGQCSDSEELLPLDFILLTSGHGTFEKEDFEHSFIYPLTESTAHIKQDEVVVVKGLGLTFIDVALALTEGRGGKFIRDESGKLTYLLSGREVRKIIPFSRSGQFMLPRKSTILPKDFELLNDQLKVFKERQEAVDLIRDILPELNREFVLQAEKFSLKPEHSSFQKTAESTGLTFEIAVNQHLILAGNIWRKFAPIFNELYKYNRLTAVSYRVFDSHWRGVFQKLSYGPPVVNYEKLQALKDTGILDFNYVKSPEVDLKNKKIIKEVDSEDFDHMLEAIIPSASNAFIPSKLFMQMEVRGLLTFCLDRKRGMKIIQINQEGLPIGPDGVAINEIMLSGIPTEGSCYNNDTLDCTYNDYTRKWVDNIAKRLENAQLTTYAHS